MPELRVPATAGAFHGELRLTRDGIDFVPVSTREGDQLVLGVRGWHVGWEQLAGLERVAGSGGDVRIHYDGAARCVAVRVHGSLQELFGCCDEFLAARPHARDVA